MRSFILFGLLLLSASGLRAQSVPLMRYQVSGSEQANAGRDSAVLGFAAGKNAVALPLQSTGYPYNGVYNDDTTTVYKISPTGMVTAYYGYKCYYNGDGLLQKRVRTTVPIAIRSITSTYYDYNSAMQPTFMAEVTTDTMKKSVYTYQGGKLESQTDYWKPAAGMAWKPPTVAGFVYGPGNDSTWIYKPWNGSANVEAYRKRVVRDVNNRILSDSLINNGKVTYITRYLYNAKGQLYLDSALTWDATLNKYYLSSWHNYSYNAAGAVTSITVSYKDVSGNLGIVRTDSLTYNSYSQCTSRQRFQAGVLDTTSITQRFYYDLFPVGINEVKQVAGIELYPVPAGDYINLQASFTAAQPFTVAVYDMSGRQLLQWQEEGQVRYNKQLSLANIPAGIYTLHLYTGRETYSRQFSVVK
ncbi:T9SS type A sorting domain-containing protein [Polluticoccus soli]|uniref:T9SS type A sorting domain-containing protein n=1 Tax=Polluticoccus soli TaxID=3034150 RepID=UPI0023E0CEF9|nr:T9SS type A sorting domain-containing protein [Flavipsychrobacter sp. JY13-12]